MRIARFGALSALLILCSGAQAQAPREAELAYRFLNGRSMFEEVRVVGDLRASDEKGGARITLDAAGIRRLQVLEVSSTGEALVEFEPLSTAMRMQLPGTTVLMQQSGKSVSTMVNDGEVASAGDAVKPARVRFDKSGKPVVEAAGDRFMTFVEAGALGGLVLPNRKVAVGEGWTSEVTTDAAKFAGGGASIELPALVISGRHVLRSLGIEEGRLVATIATRTETAARDGGSAMTGAFTSRFDVEAGAMIVTAGSVFVDAAPSTAEGRDASATGRLTGQVQMRTAVIATFDEQSADATAAGEARPPATDSRVPQPRAPETPKPPVEPLRPSSPPAVADGASPTSPQSIQLPPETGRLGPERENWSLAGGETLRYFGAPTPRDCRGACEREQDCRGYTWVKPGGYRAGDAAMCYLMRSYGSANRHACCLAATAGPFPGEPQAPQPAPTPSPSASAPSSQVCWSGGAAQFFRAIHYCVSSVLPPQGERSYGPENLGRWSDGSRAWCEGSRGNGAGETIDIRIENAVPFRRLLVSNGYGRSSDSFRNNGRVKTLEVVSANGMRGRIVLPDRPGLQPIDLPGLAQDRISLKIVDVYPGARFSDVCLSFVMPDFEHEEELLLRQQGFMPKK